MKAEVIRGLLLVRGIKLTDVARNLGVARATVSQVVRGVRKSARIQKYIADQLNLSVDDIWPPRIQQEQSNKTSKKKAREIKNQRRAR